MDKKRVISQILTVLEVEALLREGKTDEAYNQLLLLVESEPQNSHAWYLLGGIYRGHQLWGEAINAYTKAKMIDPTGPAATAIESIYEILNYRHVDFLNP